MNKLVVSIETLAYLQNLKDDNYISDETFKIACLDFAEQRLEEYFEEEFIELED